MKFSSHIAKGAWAFASRGLPVVYALVLLLVIKALPKEEFGALAVFQVIFALLFTFGDNFALQAIVKYGVEPGVNAEELVTTTGAMFATFLAGAALLLWLFAHPVSVALNNPGLEALMPLFVTLVIVTLPRTLFSKVLQMRFHVREIFFIDLANFGGAALLIFLYLRAGRISTAADVILLTILAGAVSSVVAIVMVRGSIRFQARFSRAMMKRVVAFGRFQSMTGVAAALMQSLDTFLVSTFTGAVGVANYSSAKTLFRVFDVVRDTQTLFIFPASSKYHSRGDRETLCKMIEKAVSFLYLLLIPMAVVLYVLAPPILTTLFAGKYDSAIPIFRILLFSSFVLPAQMVFGTAMVGFGLMREFFRVMVLSLGASAVVAMFALPLFGTPGAAIAFIAGLATQAALFYPIVRREVGFRPSNLLTRGLFDTLEFVRSRFGSHPTGS